jgi:hypothetical protein
VSLLPLGTVIASYDPDGALPPEWTVADGRRYRHKDLPEFYEAMTAADARYERWWERLLGWRRLPDFREKPTTVDEQPVFGGEPVIRATWVIRVKP